MTPPEVRFWRHVDQSDLDGCWAWTAHLNKGYGVFFVSRDARSVSAHRFAYEFLVGPIPDGMDIDHLCRNRRCVNPDHMEPVTRRENIMRSPIAPTAINARKTHCPNGHEFTLENTYGWQNQRHCRSCRRNRSMVRRTVAA